MSGRKNMAPKKIKFFNYHIQEKRIKVYENFDGKFGFYFYVFGVVGGDKKFHRPSSKGATALCRRDFEKFRYSENYAISRRCLFCIVSYV